MTDEYRLVIKRKPNGEYETRLFYGHEKIDLENPLKPLRPVLLDVINELIETNLRILFSHFKNINKLEVTISGEGLRQTYHQWSDPRPAV